METDKKRICEVDMDDAHYIGDEEDGVYYDAAMDQNNENGKWFASAIVDCNTGHFCGDAILTDDGPYNTEAEALEAGRSAGVEWCLTNDVEFDVRARELSWGFKGLDHGCDIEAPVLWGARAICKFTTEHLKTRTKYHYHVDLLHDRQCIIGAEDKLRAFSNRLNGTTKKPGPLKKFCKQCYDSKLPLMEHQSHDKPGKVIIDDVQFFYVYAGGYLYITARAVE